MLDGIAKTPWRGRLGKQSAGLNELSTHLVEFALVCEPGFFVPVVVHAVPQAVRRRWFVRDTLCSSLV